MKDLAKEFDSHFWSARGYLAVPTKKKSSNGKVRFDYRAISEEISKKHWEDHFKTDHGLTPSPIVKGNMCWWGAIDIDVYNLDEKRKYDICNKCKQLHLIPTKSKSGGLQLYAFASVEVPTRLMKGRLIHARNVLELDPKTEIFPKQLEVNGKNYGNGITVPYRSYLKNPDSVATYGLNAHMGKLYQLGPEPFLGFIEKNCKDLEYHQQFKILDKAGSEKKIFGPGDIKYSKKEIIRKIKEQSEHPRGGTFDNWILDYVAKSVVGLMTDDFIHLVLEPLWEFADRDEEDRYQGQEREEYFDNKIANVRKHFGIEDPKISREKFFKNIVYIKQKDKFFDLSTNEEYSDKAINFTYAKFFDKTPSLYLKRYASRLVDCRR